MRLAAVACWCVTLLSVAWCDDIVNIAPRSRGMAAKVSEEYPHADLRVDVPLVLIPVHVTTPAGTTVPGLRKENFRLFEDNVEQKVVHFSNEDVLLCRSACCLTPAEAWRTR